MSSELSPRALELAQAGRALSRPTAADRRRIEKALRARLGAAVLPVEVMGFSLAARLRWPLVASALVGILLCRALLLASQHQVEATTPALAPPVSVVATGPAVVAPAPTVQSPTASVRPLIVSTEPAQRGVPAVKASVVPVAEDALAQEVELLSLATGDLHAGRASDALKLLDEHQRKFPNGILKEERRAARAQALCALGRQGEAQAELARLPEQSPSAARARQVCVASSNAQR
jgi:hypothetical protein